jgi:hypothetical protein
VCLLLLCCFARCSFPHHVVLSLCRRRRTVASPHALRSSSRGWSAARHLLECCLRCVLSPLLDHLCPLAIPALRHLGLVSTHWPTRLRVSFDIAHIGAFSTSPTMVALTCSISLIFALAASSTLPYTTLSSCSSSRVCDSGWHNCHSLLPLLQVHDS